MTTFENELPRYKAVRQDDGVVRRSQSVNPLTIPCKKKKTQHNEILHRTHEITIHSQEQYCWRVIPRFSNQLCHSSYIKIVYLSPLPNTPRRPPSCSTEATYDSSCSRVNRTARKDGLR